MVLKILLLATLISLTGSFPTTTEPEFDTKNEEKDNDQARRIIGQR